MPMPTSPRGRGLLGVAGWLLVVMTAIVVGLTAVGALGRGIVEPVAQPLTPGQVAAEVSALTSSTSGPETLGTPTQAPSSSASPTATPVSSGATPSTSATSPADTSTPGAALSTDPAPEPAAEPGGDSAPNTAPPADPPPPPPPPAQGGTVVTATAGGTVVSRCVSGQASLTSWTPAIGFAVENLDPGPDDEVGLRFDSETVRVDVEVTCSGDEPLVTADPEGNR